MSDTDTETHAGGISPASSFHSPRRRHAEALDHQEELERRLAQAKAVGDWRKIRHLQFLIRTSYDVKLVQLTKVVRENPRTRGLIEGVELERLAGTIRLSGTTTEHVRVRAVPKAKGGHRILHGFGIVEKTRQRICALSMKPLLELPNYSFTLAGTPLAQERILSQIADPANKWVATLDIQNYYPSIDREELVRALKLICPEVITRSVILVEREDTSHISYKGWGSGSRHYSMTETPVRIASQIGLIQGAASSTIVSEFVANRVLIGVEVNSGILLTKFADDFCVVGRTRAAVEESVKTLTSAFARHPSGQFVLRSSGVRRICDGFDFLGMRFARSRRGATMRPTTKNMARFVQGTVKRLLQVDRGLPQTRVVQYVRGWVSGFKAASAELYATMVVQSLVRSFPRHAVLLAVAVEPCRTAAKDRLLASLAQSTG